MSTASASHSRTTPGPLALLVVASAAAGPACTESGDGAPPASSWPIALEVPDVPEVDAFPHVVLVTIDTLRADHVSCYGYRRETTPFLDSLAETGVLFERAISSFPFTGPSHASMLTGLHPAEHGLLRNGQELPADAADAASAFARAGASTAAFVNVEFLTGIAKGFETVEAHNGRGEKVVDAALAHLAARGQVERSLLWVHLYEPHRWKAPFMIDDSSLEAVRAATPMDDEAFFGYVAELHGLEDPGPGVPFDPGIEYRIGNREINVRSRRDFLDMVDRYDALTHQADRQLERLYRGVQELSGGAPTLWIVTSDHGEGLLSHYVVGHGKSVFQEQIQVPLVMHASDGSLGGPRRVDAVVQLVDLFPTLAEVAGARVVGADPELRGSSLWPLLRGVDGWSDRPAFSQRYPREDSGPEGVPDEEILYALQTQRSKVILRATGEYRFIDLEADPKELVGIVAEPTGEAGETLRGRLVRMLETFRAPRAAGEVRSEWIEELRALGYVE